MTTPAANPRTALVLGATSDIGRAIARQLAREGWHLQLLARDPAGLQREADDLAARNAPHVQTHLLEALSQAGNDSWLDALEPLPELAVCVIGLLRDQAESERDAAAATQVMRTNFEAPALLFGALATRFAQRGSGVLVGVSSVAGDRGRASNYVYGAAKAGFTAFLSGLRARLATSAVHVVTVKPGFVRTRMTAGMALPDALTASPEAVAHAVSRAVRRRQNVVYVEPIWRLIMLLIRHLPEHVFKRLRL